MLMAAFFMPMAAYAVEVDAAELPSVISESPEEPEETPIQTEEPITSEPSISAIPAGAFTPDGQASVVDRLYEYDGKEFYTFKTPAGNVFYLIIDHSRDKDNVYFLSAVNEAALIALAEKAGVTVSESVIPTSKSPAGTDSLDETEPPSDEPGTPAKPGGMNPGKGKQKVDD
jgi:hypothetical protein